MDIQTIIIAVITMAAVWLIRELQLRVPDEFLPLIAVAFGGLADYLARISDGGDAGWWSVAAGLLAIGIREALSKGRRVAGKALGKALRP